MVTKTLTSSKKTSNRFNSFFQIIYYFFERIIEIFLINPFKLLFRNNEFFRKNVKNQIILITGGGSGLGQLMTIKFLKLDAKVIIWDINQNGLDETRKMVEENSELINPKLYCYKMDLSNPNDIYETAKLVQNEIGSVDILINNAGVVNGKNILDLEDDKIEFLFRVNSLAHFYTIKTFLPEMIKRQQGHIVTVASICGNLGVAQLTDYCASKFACIGMEQSLRFELAKANLLDKIKTTIIKPWLISTGMFAGATPGLLPYLIPDQVAEKIVNAILEEKIQLTIPWYLDYLITILVWFMPTKCYALAFDFMGGFESMNNFQGRSFLSKKDN